MNGGLAPRSYPSEEGETPMSAALIATVNDYQNAYQFFDYNIQERTGNQQGGRVMVS